MKVKFYVTMVVWIGALFLNAIIQFAKIDARENSVRLERFETLSWEQCAERDDELTKEFEKPPKTAREYFRVLGRSYSLIGSAQKAMRHPLPTWSDRTGRDFRLDDKVRSIPVHIQGMLPTYANYLGPIADKSDPAAYAEAQREYEATGVNPLRQPAVSVPGRGAAFWWFWAHMLAIPFVFVHFAIQLRARGLRVFYDVFWNLNFPLWLFFWEVGLFRYPTEVSPAEQLRRARRWATLVLSLALSCFAGTGKVCEEKTEHAPQHQKYDGLWSRASFSTTTLSNYLGLDGGVFFPAPVQQSNVTLALPCGLYAGMFDSEPLGKRDLRPNYGREMDFTLGWSRSFGAYSVDASATYLNVFPLGKLPRGDVLQLSEKITRKISFKRRAVIAPYVWLRQAMPTRGPTPIGGSFIHGGITLSRTLTEHASASITSEVVHDSGAFGFRPGYIGQAVGAVSWKRGHGVGIQCPLVTFADPVSHTADGRRPELSFGIGFSFSPAH